MARRRPGNRVAKPGNPSAAGWDRGIPRGGLNSSVHLHDSESGGCFCGFLFLDWVTFTLREKKHNMDRRSWRDGGFKFCSRNKFPPPFLALNLTSTRAGLCPSRGGLKKSACMWEQVGSFGFFQFSLFSGRGLGGERSQSSFISSKKNNSTGSCDIPTFSPATNLSRERKASK